MKRADIFLNLVIILSIIIFVTIIDDFLSLHDINKDYISKSALIYLQTETSKDLPDWTNTKLEWLSVTVSWFVKFILIVFNLIILFIFKKNFQNKSENA